MSEYTDADLIEMWEERAAIREFDATDVLQWENNDNREAHRRWAERQAVYDVRRLVGPGVPMPKQIRDAASKFKEQPVESSSSD